MIKKFGSPGHLADSVGEHETRPWSDEFESHVRYRDYLN